MRSWLGAQLAALRHAMNGIVCLLRTEANARVHLLATLIVTGMGWLLSISRADWCAIVLAIGLVWLAEGLNTAVERVVDLCGPEYSLLAGQAKDLAAGAVLLAAGAAAVVGLIVFLPPLMALL